MRITSRAIDPYGPIPSQHTCDGAGTNPALMFADVPQTAKSLVLIVFEGALVFWVPSIALSGMTVYTGNRFPAWKGNIFVGGMRYGEIPPSGRLERLVFNDKMEELRREALLTDLRQRIRDVRQGPDGLLYLLTEEEDGALLRIEPAP